MLQTAVANAQYEWTLTYDSVSKLFCEINQISERLPYVSSEYQNN